MQKCEDAGYEIANYGLWGHFLGIFAAIAARLAMLQHSADPLN